MTPPVPQEAPGWFKRYALALSTAIGSLTLASIGLKGLGDFADDAAAAAGGVGIGQPYRNGSNLMVRVA